MGMISAIVIGGMLIIVPLVCREEDVGDTFRPHISGPEINDLEVKATYPENRSTNLPAGEVIQGTGTFTGNLEGREIWILLYGSDQNYYPQSASDACQMLPALASNGHWQVNLLLGVNPLEQLDIVATVTNADSQASQKFKDWLKTGCEKKEFPGISISDLPDGLTEMDALTIRTAKRCFIAFMASLTRWLFITGS